MIQTDVAIIGGGFSGCAVAAQLAARAEASLSLTLFELEGVARGAAYGTPHPELLLNTRAQLMSLYPDDPDHFVRWLGARGAATDFVSRRLYGDYLVEIANRTFERPGFSRVVDWVRRVRRSPDGGFVVEAASSEALAARTLVLATGNPLPSDDFLPRELVRHPGYIADPWRFAYGAVGGHVLIVGSGLTALDVLVALQASGHRGAVHVVSRRGRFPEVHGDGGAYDVIPAIDTSSARAALRSFRRHVQEAAQRGFDWQCVIDAIRPQGEALWRRLPPEEQRRFERHLRTRWERHRHRTPAQIDDVRRSYERSGRFFTYAGSIAGTHAGNVEIALRGGGSVELRPDWIVNCTGLSGTRAMAKDPMLAELLAEGTLSAGPGELGLRTTPDLAAIDARGSVVPGLWIAGPPVRGSRFEATAVPELRVMAELAATEILQTLPAMAVASEALG